jgi:hypothetical protein
LLLGISASREPTFSATDSRRTVSLGGDDVFALPIVAWRIGFESQASAAHDE